MGLTGTVGEREEGIRDRIILRQTSRNGFTLVVSFRLHFRALFMLIKITWAFLIGMGNLGSELKVFS